MCNSQWWAISVRVATATQKIPIPANTTNNETATRFLLCLDRMAQMFSRYVSNNFLFEEGW